MAQINRSSMSDQSTLVSDDHRTCVVDAECGELARVPLSLLCRRVRRGALVFIVAISVFLPIAGIFVLSVGMMSDSNDNLEDVIAETAFAAHPVIAIDGDAEFDSMAASESWPGNGHWNDPYLIEGYDIDGFGYKTGVSIANTTVYFSLRNCYVHDCGVGIALRSVVNCVIENNSLIRESPYGVHGYDLADSTIISNTCSDCTGIGIFLEYSTLVTIESNSCTRCGDYLGYGISLGHGTSSITVRWNECNLNGLASDGAGGVFVAGTGNALIENNCSNNSAHGIEVDGEGHVINKNRCTNNSKGIYLSTAIDCTISENDCSGCTHGDGIQLRGGGESLITNNICNNGSRGIWLRGSNDCVVSYNECCNNYLDGISSDTDSSLPSGNDFIGNICLRNNKSGISMRDASGTGVNGDTLQGNTCSWNGVAGIHIQSQDTTSVIDSVCSYNSQAGIWIEGCAGTTLTGNTMVENGMVLVSGTLLGWVLNEIDDTNTVNGLPVFYLKDSNGGWIPSGCGEVILANCRNMLVENVTISWSSVGITLGYCLNVTVANCTVTDEVCDGIAIYHSESCTVMSNVVQNNTHGIRVSSSESNVISNNDCSWNTNGISLLGASFQTVENNTVERNSIGVLIQDSSFNVIRGNLIQDNAGYGVCVPMGDLHFPHSWSNTIYANIFVYNNAGTDVYSPNSVQAHDHLGQNYWNVSGLGNWWSDWLTPDSNGDGIVDVPYRIDGYVGVSDPVPYDYIPLAEPGWEPIPEFGPGALVLTIIVSAIAISAIARLKRC